MTLYAVRYEYAPGSAERRDLHRPAHVAFLRGLFEAGTLALSGRLEHEESPGALLVVRADDPATVEATLDADPFWSADVIRERDVRRWNVAFASAVLD